MNPVPNFILVSPVNGARATSTGSKPATGTAFDDVMSAQQPEREVPAREVPAREVPAREVPAREVPAAIRDTRSARASRDARGGGDVARRRPSGHDDPGGTTDNAAGVAQAQAAAVAAAGLATPRAGTNGPGGSGGSAKSADAESISSIDGSGSAIAAAAGAGVTGVASDRAALGVSAAPSMIELGQHGVIGQVSATGAPRPANAAAIAPGDPTTVSPSGVALGVAGSGTDGGSARGASSAGVPAGSPAGAAGPVTGTGTPGTGTPGTGAASTATGMAAGVLSGGTLTGSAVDLARSGGATSFVSVPDPGAVGTAGASGLPGGDPAATTVTTPAAPAITPAGPVPGSVADPAGTTTGSTTGLTTGTTTGLTTTGTTTGTSTTGSSPAVPGAQTPGGPAGSSPPPPVAPPGSAAGAGVQTPLPVLPATISAAAQALIGAGPTTGISLSRTGRASAEESRTGDVSPAGGLIAPASAAPIATVSPADRATATPPVDGGQPVLGQVMDHLAKQQLITSRNLRDGMHQAIIHLNPDNLGQVTVTMDVRAGQVRLDLAAAPQALSALGNDLGQLRSQLANSGLNLADVTLSAQTTDPGAGQQQPQQPRDGQFGNQAGTSGRTGPLADQPARPGGVAGPAGPATPPNGRGGPATPGSLDLMV